MSASASSWECFFVGLRGLIVSVTHHHYIDSISFKMFQDMSEMLIKRVSGFTVSEVCAYETMFSMVLLWQWDFQGSVKCHATQKL